MKKRLIILLVGLSLLCMAPSPPITITRPPLIVGEVDGSPKVHTVTEIQMPNDSVTDVGGGKVRIGTAGGVSGVPSGGTGAATFTDGGILVGAGVGPIEAVPVGLATEVLVGGGAATNPVWTATTGTGAPVRATSPTLVTPALGTPASGDLSNTTLLTPPVIGKTTPKEGWLSPSVAKGPAIITTFAGTVSTSGSSTTIAFTSAADAILAGYNAINPVLGTTLITTTFNQASVTRYIVSWTNATACVVDSVCTLAASSTLASVQLPISTFVNSAGVTQGWMNAAGNAYFIQNVGIGGTRSEYKLEVNAGSVDDVLKVVTARNVANSSLLTLYPNRGATNVANADRGQVTFIHDKTGSGTMTAGIESVVIDNASATGLGFAFSTGGMGISNERIRIDNTGNVLTGGLTAAGTSAAKVFAIGAGTMPTALVADAVQLGVAEYNGATGDQRLNIYSEATVAKKTAIGSGTVSINGAVTSGGGLTRQLAEATSGALSGASGSIAVNVPTGARILGVQLRVDTLITAETGVSWTAVYVNTPTTAICAAQAFTKNTKFNAVHPAYEITTGTVTITITPDAGTFTAGVIRAIVYYEAIDAMSDAA